MSPEDQGLLTTSAFGRQIGLTGSGLLTRLIDNGHMPASRVKKPTNNGWHLYISQEDSRIFHEKFMTSRTMAARYCAHGRSLTRRLEAAGITPFRPDGQDYGYLYLKEDVERVLGTLED